jgi:hypothetical protein
MLIALFISTGLSNGVNGQGQQASTDSGTLNMVQLETYETSELRESINRYTSDRSALQRRWDVPYSQDRRNRLTAFYYHWRDWASQLDYESLSLEAKIDHTLFTNLVEYELKLIQRETRLASEMANIVPFASTIVELHESRRHLTKMDPRATAELLNDLPAKIQVAHESVQALIDGGDSPSRIVGLRASGWLNSLSQLFESWFEFYDGYDPMFSWWNAEPYVAAETALADYKSFLEESIVGFKANEDPPMIPYSPQELIEIAREEFAWCENELLRASNELGYGDDWKAAQEYVKTLFVEPGSQTDLVRDLALEAVDFVESRDLVTVPDLAKEVWRMEMLSPERQKIAPFFLGGEVVRVAFPTDEMAHADKMMSLRGNNEHYSRAVVHHELIPGHHLQGFMTSRYNTHRRVFGTPFWGEGWALYWEMLLWDEGFAQSPEDRVGMLFWRMHRAARIIFSLSFHLGEMTPDEAIDFLVERVGHERANATAEVRRSFNGTYSPLYQAAYMLGGIQLRSLHGELVGSGKMTNREFHDEILKGGRMPIEMVRARLLGIAPAEDFKSDWRFRD